MTQLTPAAVQAIMKKVLFDREELVLAEQDQDGVPVNAVIVEGLVRSFGFHKERLAAAKPAIDELLRQLPEEFNMNIGGGWSFLQACMDRNGEQWTGLHKTMEELVVLGIAVGSANWLGKNMMNELPGGMPYFEIHLPEATQ